METSQHYHLQCHTEFAYCRICVNRYTCVTLIAEKALYFDHLIIFVPDRGKGLASIGIFGTILGSEEHTREQQEHTLLRQNASILRSRYCEGGY